MYQERHVGLKVFGRRQKRSRWSPGAINFNLLIDAAVVREGIYSRVRYFPVKMADQLREISYESRSDFPFI